MDIIGTCKTFAVRDIVCDKQKNEVTDTLKHTKKPPKHPTTTYCCFEGCNDIFGCTIYLKGENIEILHTLKSLMKYILCVLYNMKLELKYISDCKLSTADIELQNEPSMAPLKRGQTILSSSPDVIYGDKILGNWTISSNEEEINCYDCCNIIYGTMWICDQKQCDLPIIQKLEFYSDKDPSLGEVLKSFSFNTFKCNTRKCKANTPHYLIYCCYRGILSVSITKKSDDSGEDVYSSCHCKRCDTTSDKYKLSDDSLQLSFAKYLEISFYNSHLKSTCGHSYFHDCSVYYEVNNIMITFDYKTAFPYDISTKTLNSFNINWFNEYTRERWSLLDSQGIETFTLFYAKIQDCRDLCSKLSGLDVSSYENIINTVEADVIQQKDFFLDQYISLYFYIY